MLLIKIENNYKLTEPNTHEFKLLEILFQAVHFTFCFTEGTLFCIIVLIDTVMMIKNTEMKRLLKLDYGIF